MKDVSTAMVAPSLQEVANQTLVHTRIGSCRRNRGFIPLYTALHKTSKYHGPRIRVIFASETLIEVSLTKLHFKYREKTSNVTIYTLRIEGCSPDSSEWT